MRSHVILMTSLTTAQSFEEAIIQKHLAKYFLAFKVLLVFTAEPRTEAMNMSIPTTDAVVFNRLSCFMPKRKMISLVKTNSWV